jgi:2-amino-4,5-dihydroxy-6-oxo-7-(phosphooxy)heptanoate synthase
VSTGRTLRLRRLFPSRERRLFSIPLDHSVSMGPVDGLESARPVVETLAEAGADAVIVTKGAVRSVEPVLRPSMLLGVHLSASTSLSPTPDLKLLAGTAAEAVALGADFASVQVNFGVAGEAEMLRDLGAMVDQCGQLGLPLLCMAYVKRPTGRPTADELRHACRAAADLGADLVKTSHPGSPAELRRLVSSTPVPLLLGGGVKAEDDAAFLGTVRESVDAGVAGICIGRNLFQRQPLAPLAREVARILHGAG